MVDYESLKNEVIRNSASFFKPETGEYQIIILSEPEEYTYIDKKTNQLREYWRFVISVNNKEYIWNVPKGLTQKSLYGQLVVLGALKGQLREQLINLIVMNNGDMKSYVVKEYLNIFKKKTGCQN